MKGLGGLISVLLRSHQHCSGLCDRDRKIDNKWTIETRNKFREGLFDHAEAVSLLQ